MARWKRVLPLLALGVALSCGHAQDLVVTEVDDGKTLPADVDQSITVTLAGNPSTGFAWQLTATNGDSVAVTGPAVYTADPDGLPGSGGTFSFPFRAVQSGVTGLSFAYLQPWDPASVARTFSVTIDVSGVSVPPALAIVLTGTNVVIRWPRAGSDGYYLEGTRDIFAFGWAALNVLPLPDGTNYQVTLAATGNALVFRLHR